MGLKRMGLVQLAVIALLSKGMREFHEVVDFLSSLSIPKSSIYSAIDELQRKGVLKIREETRGRRELVLANIGREKVVEVRRRLVSRIKNLIVLLTLLGEEVIDYSDFSPRFLEHYREFLRRELSKVEEELSKWRKIKVE